MTRPFGHHPRRRAMFLAMTTLFATTPVVANAPVRPAEVVRSYPHDTAAFTEGLLIRNGQLFESTGFEGQSFILRKELATGRVIERVAIPPNLFGEGIVDWRNRLYSFVWHGGQGFVWKLGPPLRHAGSWRYTGEGWGLTNDGRHIIMSDGTDTLRFLVPGSMKVARRLPVTTDGQPVNMLNELEFVHGEILANVWQTPLIARIDPATGHVKGWIDLTALWRSVNVSNPGAVPNGIAYDRAKDSLYVTGKNWPRLFQIRLPQR